MKLAKLATRSWPLSWSAVWPYLIAVFVAWLSYRPILMGGFAADEWWAMGYAIRVDSFSDILKPAGIFAPLANLWIYLLYQLFDNQPVYYAAIALGLHLINTALWLNIVWRLSGQKYLAIAAAAGASYFIASNEFITHLSLMSTSGMATTFGLFGLSALIRGRARLAALFYLAGLLFSAYILPFIGVYWLWSLIYQWPLWAELKKSRLHSLKPLLWSLGSTGLALAIYYWLLNKYSLKAGGLYDRPTDQSLIDRLEAMSHKVISAYSEFFHRPGGLIQVEFHWLVGVTILATVAVLAFYAWRTKQLKLARLIIWSGLTIGASLILFVNLNTVASNVVLPSRYFYLASFAYSTVLATGLSCLTLSDRADNRTTRGRDLTAILTTVVMLAWLSLHFSQLLQEKIMIEVNSGRARAKILRQFVSTIPVQSLGRDNLFCIISDTGHFGTNASTIPLPFIINPFFPLATEYLPSRPELHFVFERSDYFVNPAASSYWYVHPEGKPWEAGFGLGYAKNLADCRKLIVDNPFINLSGVYGFVYTGKENTLKYLDQQFRDYLADKTTDTLATDQAYAQGVISEANR